jgi:hypothetical protein
MSEIFVMWADYDGGNCHAFPGRGDKNARMLVAKILREQEAKVNGTRLLAVIEGKNLVPEVVERVQDVRFREARNVH